MREGPLPPHPEPHLVHLSVGAIADHLYQLEDACRVLRGRGERKMRYEHFSTGTRARGGEGVRPGAESERDCVNGAAGGLTGAALS